MNTRICYWLGGLFALVIAAGLIACGDDDDDAAAPVATTTATSEADTPIATDPAFPLTVERSDGVELTIEEPPERIVSLDPSATEIFYAVGAGDQLVAADLFSNFPEEVGDKARLDAFLPSPEAIISEDPDLIVIFSNESGIVETLDSISSVQLQVLYLEVPTDLDGVFERIQLFADISGHSTEAEDLVDSLIERLNIVLETVGDDVDGPRIFHELDNLLFTVGPESFIGALYEVLGAENIAAAAGEPFPQLSSEAVIAADPEVIVLADESFGEDIETVRARPGWDVISAVVQARVHGVDPDIASRPGPRIIDFLEMLAVFLYPEKFE